MCSALAKNVSNFEFALSRAKSRQASHGHEALFVKKNLSSVIRHLRDIKLENPDITHEQMEKILFDEIDKYATCVFHNSYVFTESMQYLCCRYLQSHKDKFDEISQKIKETDPGSINSFQDCRDFDECLGYYVYSLKKALFNMVLSEYTTASDENYKNFDELLEKNLGFYSQRFFGDHFELPQISEVLTSSKMTSAQKRNKIKEFSTWYKSPASKKRFLIFANLFMNKSFSYLSYDQEAFDKSLRNDLSTSTASLVENLDSLGHLDGYLILYVNQMCEMGFPEYASVVCKNGMPNKNFSSKIEACTSFQRTQAIKEIINPEGVKQMLSANVLNSKNISLEGLLALNSFWSNRYVKELSLYSESMFAVNQFGLIDKVLAGEEIDVSQDQIKEMLLKMDTLYPSARTYFEKKQIEVNNHISQDAGDSELSSPDEELEEKIVRYSYEPYFEKLQKSFGSDYSSYFDETLPGLKNDLVTDADWYVRLQNPIYGSYEMKDESIKVLLTNLGLSEFSELANAGIILDNVSDEGFFSTPSSKIGIGFDAGLSYPVRIHARLDVIRDYLKSITGNAIVPVYEGADDFYNPFTGEPLTSHVVLPMNDKQKSVIKKNQKTASSREYPNFVSHLCMVDSMHVPDHLKTEVGSSGKKAKKQFNRRYIDLDTGAILSKDGDKFVPVKEKSQAKGGSEHGIE